VAEPIVPFKEARQELAKSLKQVIAAHASQLADLRKRELKKSAGGALTEPCLLCANLPSACTCNLRKAEGGTCERCQRPMGNKYGDSKLCGSCNRKPAAPAPKPEVKKNAALGYGNEPGQSKMGPDVVGKNEMCKAHASAHPMGKCDLSEVKPGKNVAKGELPAVHAAPEKKVPGAALPKAGKDQGSDKDASGGKLVKKSEGFLTKLVKAELRKDLASAKPGAMPLPGAAAPKPPKAVVGVPGKQPVGQGGGDAHKIAPAAASVAHANKELGGFKSIAASPFMPGKKQIVGAQKFGKDEMAPAYGKKVGVVTHGDPTAQRPVSMAGPQVQATGVANTPAASTPQSRSPILRRRVSGMVASQAALARNEEDPSGEPMDKGLSGVNHNRKLLVVK
jgi:hypothetical protein